MKTRISTLMDGELDDQSAREAIATAARESEAAEAWRTYHLISDAIRGTRLLSDEFSARMAERLAAEPTVLAPQRVDVEPAPRAWFAMSAAASVAAVALVGWVAFAPQQEFAPAALPLAQVKPAPEAVAIAAPMPVAANEYLLAHQAFSPRVSLQGMAPYVRSVANER
jgi:sigma-E factor negative regulatory protein RseA